MLKTDNAKRILETLEGLGYEPLTYSTSNLKYIPSAEMGYLIWNIPAVKTCPNRTPHCEAGCYARKAEFAYPDVLPYRTKHWEEAQEADFAFRMTLTILKRRKFMRKPELTEGGIVHELILANKRLNDSHNFSIWDAVLFDAMKKEKKFRAKKSVVISKE